MDGGTKARDSYSIQYSPRRVERSKDEGPTTPKALGWGPDGAIAGSIAGHRTVSRKSTALPKGMQQAVTRRHSNH
eukprot:9200569-Alexandrium_andersonii.AAC.1